MDKTYINTDKIFRIYNRSNDGISSLIEFFKKIDNEIIFEGVVIEIQKKIYKASINENHKKIGDLIVWMDDYLHSQHGHDRQI